MDNQHDDKLNEKLDKLERLVEEDHKMIKGMHSRMRLANAFRIVYWAVIILAAFGAYVWLQPYVEKFKQAYDSVNEFRTNITGTDNSEGFFEKFKEYFDSGTSTKK